MNHIIYFDVESTLTDYHTWFCIREAGLTAFWLRSAHVLQLEALDHHVFFQKFKIVHKLDKKFLVAVFEIAM